MSVVFHRKIVRAGSRLALHVTPTPKRLPWRIYRTPYRIFLAEMLLIRTRADVVARVYEDIYKKYPNILALASAQESDLRMVLYPLGLAKRTPYIIMAASYIYKTHKGKIPRSVDALLKVPGLGMYTASAIAVFAYHQDVVPSDVNILRFVARLTGLEMENKTKGSKQLMELAPFLAKKNTGLSIEKLLDFTRLVCRPETLNVKNAI